MLKLIEQLEPRFKIMIYIACLGENENAFELFRFAPESNERSFVEATRELLSLPKKERTRLITKELKESIHLNKSSSLVDIHPGWFFDFLKEESNQTIHLILRYLPGEVGRYVLAHLSLETQKAIRQIDESKKVSEEIVQLIRKRFESQFLTLASPTKSEEIDLYHLYFVKVEQLLSFFRDLGLEQLSRAFKGVDVLALKALLNRLSIQDAKDFQIKMKSLAKVSHRELKEAQMLLLNLPLDTIEPELLFTEVGISFFARAMTKEDLEFVKALQFKLPPRYGYILKRYVSGSLISSKPSITEWAKKQVLMKFQSFPLN